jgi:SEC-C motif-containing protein
LSASYDTCCGRYHTRFSAPTPEALMRSRYSAFALSMAEYLLATWHISTRPENLDLATPPQPKWISLKILNTTLQDETHGTVHFIATCRVGGRAEKLEETSRFVFETERWFYLDADVSDT